MFMVWLGVILIALKLLEVPPVAEWGWLWLLSPFGGRVPVVRASGAARSGRDRRSVEHIEWEERRRQRIAQTFADPHKGRRQKAVAAARAAGRLERPGAAKRRGPQARARQAGLISRPMRR